MKRFINAQIFSQNQLISGNLYVDKGVIQKIESNDKLEKINPPIDEEIDCHDQIILPGFIDTHVHFRDLDQEYKETVETGSQAALSGGVTTVITMPNTKPTLDTVEMIRKYRKLNRQLYCNIGIFAGIGSQFNLNHIMELKNEGVFGLKIYPGSTGINHIPEWNSNWMEIIEDPISLEQDLVKIQAKYGNKTNLSSWEKLFKAVKNARLPLLFHTELPLTPQKIKISFEESLKDIKKKHDKNPELIAHDQSHPFYKNETNLVHAMVGILTTIFKDPLQAPHIHFCHVSGTPIIDFVKQAKLENWPITVEVTPHHILLNNQLACENQAYAKVLVPLRSPEMQQSLWIKVQEGQVDTIGTDHAPHSIEEKNQPFFDTPSGFPGIDVAVPLLLTQVCNYQLALDKLIKYYATNPAQIFGLERKGQILPGYDADLVVVEKCDLNHFNAAQSLSKAKWSPYQDIDLRTRVKQVYLKGNLAFDLESGLMKPYGEWIRKT